MPRFSVLLPLVAIAIAGSASAIAQQPPPQQPQQPQQPMSRPCAAIRQVCLQAGFVREGARVGDGLVVDCIRPIMLGMAQRPRATKPLPAVDPALVAACHAQNPNFGMANAQRRNTPAQAPGQPPQAAPGPGPDEPPQEPPAAPGQPPQAPPAQH
ncbi:MAG TPA: hypothetical protein VKX28_05230 [Xanthobacteraceae bacterium]|nr:hypothetical protein [Xanthobacteraceae bacterium]